MKSEDATMILTVISGRERDLVLAGIAGAGLCGAGLIQAFPGNLPSRPSVANRGSIEVQCDVGDGPLVRQGFLHAGFDTIERLAVPNIPAPANVVTVTSGPEDQRVLQMADPAADALCGAGLTVAYIPMAGLTRVICPMTPLSNCSATNQIRKRS
jgi:hypothetical protein